MVTTLDDDPLLKPIPLVEGWKVLAPVVLYAKIGQGGMGSVYRGRHLDFDIDVAVKCLKPSLAAEDEQFIARFRREARLAAGLTHENLVRVYDYRRAHGIHYLVMEFIDGETARERVMRKGALNEYEAATIILGAARGLAKAHRNEETIVHRDVKPDNILISRRGEVKLADLGIAKALEHEDGATFNTQGVIGTPQYMAPEQWERDQAMGPQSDIWSFGATLYFLLTGENAIRAGTEKQVYVDICQKPFPDVRTKRPEVSSALAAILKKCLRKDMNERYADAGELADALAGFIGQQTPSLVDRGSGTERTVALVSPPPMPTMKRIRTQVEGSTDTGATPTPGGTVIIRRSSARWWWIGGGVAAAAVALVVGLKLLGGGGGGGDSNAGIVIEGLAGDKLYTNQPTLQVRGSAPDHNGRPVMARFAGAEQPTAHYPEEDGRFTLPLTLTRNTSETLRLSLGNSKASIECTVVQDSMPPVIQILEPQDGSFTNQKKITVKVKLTEDNAKTLKIGLIEFKPDGDGIWVAEQVALDSDTTRDLDVDAVDQAGNAAETRSFTITRDIRKPVFVSSNLQASSQLTAGDEHDVHLEFDEPILSAKVNDKDVPVRDKRATTKITVPSKEGAFKLAYSVVDRAGNPFSDSMSFEVVTRKVPRFELTPDVAQDQILYVAGTTLELTGTVVNATTRDLQVFVDGVQTDHLLQGGERISLTVPVKKRAKVELRYLEISRKFEVVPDMKVPTVEILLPKEGERRTKDKQIRLSVRVVDENPKHASFGLAPMDRQPDASWSKLVELKDGKNEFSIGAEDLAGNLAEPVKLVVELDSAEPVLKASTHKERSSVDVGATIALELTFSEELRKASIAGKSATFSAKVAKLELKAPPAAGDWPIPYTVEDLVGNPTSGTLTLVAVTKAPLLPPSITLLGLQRSLDGTVYRLEETPTFKCRIENPNDEKISVTVDGKTVPCGLVAGQYEFKPKLPADKPVRIALRYGDVSEAFTAIYDSKSPEVTIEEPAAETLRTNKPLIRIVARVKEANPGEVQLDGQPMTAAGDGRWQVESFRLQDGLNSPKIVATDLAGRTSPVKTLSLTLDTAPPQFKDSGPSAGSGFDAGSTQRIRLNFSEAIKQVEISGKNYPADEGAQSIEVEVLVPQGDGAWTLEGSVLDLADNRGNFSVPFERAAGAVRIHTTKTLGEGWTVEDPTLGHDGWPVKVKHAASGIAFVLIAPGEFDMGSPGTERDRDTDEVVHRVILSKGFYMAETETTQKQYRNVTKKSPSQARGDDKPVESVTWKEATAFCQKIGCELPTEAQWEYACRAGGKAAFSTGATLGQNQANHNGERVFDVARDSGKGTVNVKRFKPNEWKLYDLHGNVAEWCRDGYAPYSKTSPLTDPFASGSKEVIIRGGGWMQSASDCRSANRDKWGPDEEDENTGFRCIKTLP